MKIDMTKRSLWACSTARALGNRQSSRSRLRHRANRCCVRVRVGGTRRAACAGSASSPEALFFPGGHKGSTGRGKARRTGERPWPFGGMAPGRLGPKMLHVLRAMAIIITTNIKSFHGITSEPWRRTQHGSALKNPFGPCQKCFGTGIGNLYHLANKNVCLPDTCLRKNSGRFIC